VSEERFRRMRGLERLLVARDSYSYLHLPLIAGIILVALGVKKTLGHVDEPLKTVPAVALFGGIALYYVAHVAFRWRTAHSLGSERLVAALVSLALIPVATEVDSLVALGLAAALAALLIGYESIRYGELRRRARAAAAHG
jgi:low temperature requirement protein LtrA